MFFKVFLLLASISVVFVGCFGGVDNPLQEDADVADVPEEVFENEDPIPQDPAPQGPVVRLVSEDLEWRDDLAGGDRAILRSYAEIDSALDHHLFLYVEREEHEQDDDFFDRPGHVDQTRYLIVLERGETRTGSFGTSTWKGRHMHKKLVLRLLSGEERQEIELPEHFFFGTPPAGWADRPDHGIVPEEYIFNPYQIGEPFEVSHEFDEDDLEE